MRACVVLIYGAQSGELHRQSILQHSQNSDRQGVSTLSSLTGISEYVIRFVATESKVGVSLEKVAPRATPLHSRCLVRTEFVSFQNDTRVIDCVVARSECVVSVDLRSVLLDAVAGTAGTDP